MKKTIIIFIAIILLCFFGFIFSKKYGIETTGNSGKNISSTNGVQSSDSGKIYDRFDPFKGDASLSSIIDKDQYFLVPTTNNKISIKTVDENKNSSYAFYVNNEKIGEISFVDVLENVFSGNYKYMIFRTVSVCGSTCASYDIYALDFFNKKIIEISAPKTVSDFSGPNQYNTVSTYETDFSWLNDKTAQMTFFFVNSDSTDGLTYRVSPKEIWQYDIETGEYRFTETLPEN